MPSKRTPQKNGLPTRQAILDYVTDNPTAATRRDIARAFGVKGEARTELRGILKTMEAEGVLEREGRARFSKPDELPPVAPVDVMSVDEDGDLLCMPSNWRGDDDPPMIRLTAGHAAKRKPIPGVGDRLLVRLKPAGDRGYSAEVIRAIGKGAHRFLAVYRKKRGGGVAEPVERRARNTFDIDKGDEAGAQDGDLVWVETKNSRGYGPKKGRVRTIEGHIDDRNAYSLIALANHGIPFEFPKEVMAAAEKAKHPSLGDREDLRELPLLTIDPADAKDHDDAVWAKCDDDPNNEGGFIVIVAIADVSAFTPYGGALDREALKRGNSTYLPDRVAPMLPERLSNDLCSLKEGVDRPCLAVEMVLNASGRKTRHRFLRAMMRSAAKLAYEEAQAIIEDKIEAAAGAVAETVKTLHAAYKARLIERAKRAPLDLELPERRLVLDKKGFVKEVTTRERFDAHRLIEEFMILANVAAAETLERRKTPLIYRIHEGPDPEKLEGVRNYLASLDYTLIKTDAVRPSHFNQLLKIAGEREQKEMVSEIILRAQRQAVYSPDNAGHFGLNLGRYAHFTSPIRRYADLAVHRALIKACNIGNDGQSEAEAETLEDTARAISDLERRAMAAEREATDRYMAAFLSDQVGAEFNARIRGVTRFGLFAALDETGADGFIPMRALGFERFRFDEEAHAVVGETTGGVYRLGQSVRVRLAEATPMTGGLRFDMLSDPEAGSGKKSKQRNFKSPKGAQLKRKPKKQSGASRKKSPKHPKK